MKKKKKQLTPLQKLKQRVKQLSKSEADIRANYYNVVRAKDQLEKDLKALNDSFQNRVATENFRLQNERDWLRETLRMVVIPKERDHQ